MVEGFFPLLSASGPHFSSNSYKPTALLILLWCNHNLCCYSQATGGLLYTVSTAVSPLPGVMSKPARWGYLDMCQLFRWYKSEQPVLTCLDQSWGLEYGLSCNCWSHPPPRANPPPRPPKKRPFQRHNTLLPPTPTPYATWYKPTSLASTRSGSSRGFTAPLWCTGCLHQHSCPFVSLAVCLGYCFYANFCLVLLVFFTHCFQLIYIALFSIRCQTPLGKGKVRYTYFNSNINNCGTPGQCSSNSGWGPTKWVAS